MPMQKMEEEVKWDLRFSHQPKCGCVTYWVWEEGKAPPQDGVKRSVPIRLVKIEPCPFHYGNNTKKVGHVEKIDVQWM